MERGAEQSEAAELLRRRPLQHLEICDSDLPFSLSSALSSFVRRIIQRRRRRREMAIRHRHLGLVLFSRWR